MLMPYDAYVTDRPRPSTDARAKRPRVGTAIVAAALAVLVAFPAAAAVNRSAVERQFQAWLRSDIWPEARGAGVSASTFNSAFAGVTLEWSLPDLQPPGAPVVPSKVEWQSEFKSAGPYFAERQLKALAAGGRARVAKWKRTLAAVEARYGVPAEILVAIWGKESAFGNAALPKPALRTLATSAFMGRRADFYKPELIAALQIVERHDIDVATMRSSVAGALGEPQFTPSAFLRYAQDFDRDGKKDIWSSTPDILASIAAFLAGEGWVKGRGWGVEAKVPAAVPCSLEGPEQGKPVAEWTKLGVTRVDGKPLPRFGGLSYLLMPAGTFGPAFIVTDNFYVLKQYNTSDLYALYIGQLADRFSRDRPFSAKWGDVGGFNRGDVKHMQDELVAAGYDVGGADGLIGFKTRIAVGLWQAKRGEKPTCLPDAKLIKSIH